MPTVRAIVSAAGAQDDYRFSVARAAASYERAVPDADCRHRHGRDSCARFCSFAGRRPLMFISKKHSSRRTVLQGAGATVALPLLDAMVAGAAPRSRRRPAPRTLRSARSTCRTARHHGRLDAEEGRQRASSCRMISKPLGAVARVTSTSSRARPSKARTRTRRCPRAVCSACAHAPREADRSSELSTSIDQIIAHEDRPGRRSRRWSSRSRTARASSAPAPPTSSAPT